MNRLRDMREDKDLKQKDISDYLNMDQSNYSKYELNKINIPISILISLADFYDTSIDYLLYRTDIKKPYPKSSINNIQKNPH